MPDDDLELDWKGRAPRGDGAPDAGPPPQTLARAGQGAPGDPAYMSDELRLELQGLLVGSGVKVRQFREAAQALVGWDQANQYEVCDLENRPIFYASEKRGLLAALLRNFNPFHQRHVECTTRAGTQAMVVHFPFTLFLRRGEVRAWDGRVIGRIQQRFNLLRMSLDVQNEAGKTLLTIRGPALKFLSFSDWIYEVKKGEEPVGEIRKHWGGWFAETFTNADNFSIAFGDRFTDGRLRQLLVGAALTLDLAQFEQNSKNGSGAKILGGFLDD